MVEAEWDKESSPITYRVAKHSWCNLGVAMSDSETVSETPPTGSSQQPPQPQSGFVQHPPFGAMAGIMPPGKLVTTGNVADNWKVWKQMWSNYMVIAQLKMKLPVHKVALFLHCIGVDALKIFNGFQFNSPDNKNDLAKIIQKFNEFTIGELNETFERYTFNSSNQQEDESIDAYVTALRTLVKTCNFCDCMRDSIIRDRIVLGIQVHRTRKRLLQERSLTLSKSIDFCKSSEATNLQLKIILGAQSEDVHTVQDKHPPSSRHDDKSKKSRAGKTKTCKFCGKAHPFKKGKCPAWGAKFTKCGGRNHFTLTCTTPTKKVYNLRDESSDDSDMEYITSIVAQPEMIHAVRQEHDYPNVIYNVHWDACRQNKSEISSRQPPRASVNVISVNFVPDKKLEPITKTLHMWNNTTLKPLYMCSCRLILKS